MKVNKLLRIVLLLLIICTILFIWTQSCLGKDASSAQSSWVRQFLQNAVDLLGLPIEVTVHATRKLAHFLEFFLLGLEVTLYGICGRTPDRHDIVWMPGTVFLVAFMDETIQIFSGRGPAITDVWLDIAGGVTAMLLVFAFYYLVAACKRKRGRRG